MAYKNKYYDPAKAHEYYMKHRKLKGRKKTAKVSKKKGGKAKTPTYKARTSTEGLNAAGVEASRQAQAEMNVAKAEATKRINDTMKAKINELKANMQNMNDSEKKTAIEKIKLEYADLKKKEVDALKEKYASAMDEIKKKAEYVA